ncbi:S41 family peptidase [Algoriphagus namhaensis]
MKKLFSLTLFLFLGFQLAAQSFCDCKPELKFVYEQMRSTSSYKDQIKGAKKKNFEQLYQSLQQQSADSLSLLQCYGLLNKLMSTVQDKHAKLKEISSPISAENLEDPAFISEYRQDDAFIHFPKTDQSITELQQRLQTKSIEDIEGIYAIGSKLKMGVYRVSPDSLVGVILSSEIGTWEPGHIFAYLKKSDVPSHFDITYYSPVQKNLNFSKAQFVDHGMLFSYVVKENLTKNHALIERDPSESYQLMTLKADVQYVWLNSFNRVTMPEKRDALLEQIQKDLNAKNLILDLRNNGGGADKISLPILRELKKKEVNIYVITNFYTGSNAEMTTVRLKKDFDAIHLGQRTFGAIAYGSNYGRSYDSPSGLFNFYPTDMRQREFIDYEELGVQPDLVLDQKSDWVEQTLDYIRDSGK